MTVGGEYGHVADVISCIYYLVIVTILRYEICIFFGVILLCYLCVIFSSVLPYAGQFVALACLLDLKVLSLMV